MSLPHAPIPRPRALHAAPALLTALLGLLLLLGFAAPASAATPAPTPTPGSNSGTLIDPAKAKETIQVFVRKVSDRSGVAGAKLTVSLKTFTVSVTTGKDGKVLVGLPSPGTYTIRLDTSSLPKGAGTVDPAFNPRQLAVDAGNTGVPAFFNLASGSTGGSQPSTSAGSSSGASPSGGPAGTAPSGGDGGATLLDQILPRLATGTIFGLLLALASIGVSLIYGTTGLNNFAHGELVTFGGLAGYTFSGILGLPTIVGLVAATVLGGAFGYLQDLGLWRPLRRRGVALVPLMIVSIGLSLALRYIFEFIYGADQLTLPADDRAAVIFGPIRLRSSDIGSAIVCIVLLLLVAFVLLRTRIGKATRAVADNRSLAAASGIDVERVIRLVWVGAGALAGLAGVLIGYYQSLRWDTGASILLLIFAAVTLGGFGTAFGALVGSLVIGILTDMSTIIVPSNLKYVAALVVIIVILLFRPQGILGRRARVG